MASKVYEEESLMDPVEYYVDAYKKTPFLAKKNTKKENKAHNEKYFEQYLDSFIRIYNFRNQNPQSFSREEMRKKFERRIELERKRRKAMTKEEREKEKKTRRDKRIFKNKITDILKDPTKRHNIKGNPLLHVLATEDETDAYKPRHIRKFEAHQKNFRKEKKNHLCRNLGLGEEHVKKEEEVMNQQYLLENGLLKIHKQV